MDETRGLWRGKRIDEKKWTYGYLISPGVDGKVAYIGYLVATDDHGVTIASVDPQTLGECTGLRDKNGKLIFEGDIVQVNHPHNGTSIHEVIWDEYCWNLKGFYASCYDAPPLAFSEGTTYMTVIGNIHDNPELLKGENDVP